MATQIDYIAEINAIKKNKVGEGMMDFLCTIPLKNIFKKNKR